jgi:Na+/melibiose symporter-like transporter
MYILQAAFEYLISLLVSGSFLATLTKHLGFSDSLTGILSSVISLGCLFQLLSILIRRKTVKRFVIITSLINQVLFMLLYVIPVINVPKPVKTAVFVAVIFLAYLVYNVAHPKKINWLMSLVDSNRRGSFTANKEIVSLVSGMVFSFGMGALIDRFVESGKTKTAFIVSAGVIFALMVIHSLTMIFSVEKECPSIDKASLKQSVTELFKNKQVLKIAVMFLLYYSATYVSTPFYSTYQIGELGFSLKFVSVIVMCGSVSRIFVSKFWGRYADKTSFAKMVEKCFGFLAVANLCVVFATPANGKVMFLFYYLFHGIVLGGINSALTNLIFERVNEQKRADALAFTQAVAGLSGFLTTLIISPVVALIQQNSNRVFGLPVYAQQFVSAAAFLLTVLAIVYTRCVFIKKEIK